MCPMRLRRTRLWVTLTPQRSQMMPLCLMPLYLPQAHSQSRSGRRCARRRAVLLRPVGAVVDRLGLLDLAVRPGADVSGDARVILTAV